LAIPFDRSFGSDFHFRKTVFTVRAAGVPAILIFGVTMKVLVSGAGGFLGQYVVKRLLERNHEVRAIFRPRSVRPSWIDKVDPLFVDLERDNLLEAFDGIDVVIHLAGATSQVEHSSFKSTVTGTERFFSAMASSKARRLLHISSLAVYDFSLAETILNENTPVLKTASDMGEYAVSKLLQEAVAFDSARINGWDLTVLRPGFIWGPGRAELAGTGRRFWRFYFLIGPFAMLPLCHVINCANLIVDAMEKPAAIGEIFNAVDHNNIKRWRYLYEYIRRTGLLGPILPVPYSLGLSVAKLVASAASRLFRISVLPSLLTPRRFEAQLKPLAFSNGKLREKLNWVAPLDFEACLKSTYCANGNRT
jgi:UDP-glucose 4-epimerase